MGEPLPPHQSISDKTNLPVHLLYGGAIRLEFDPQRHRYFVQDGEGEPFSVPSVTTVLGVMDKPWLLQWAVNSAVELCKGAIQPDCPYPEIYLDQVWSNARSGFRRIKEHAANTGTQVHNFLETYLQSDEKPVLPPENTDVRRCVDAAIAWLSEHRVEPVAIERRVYSRKLRCSGTLDKLARVDGELAVIDWKSSKAIYPEYRLQTAAYQGFYEEETGERIEKRWLIKLGKEDGAFEAQEYSRGEYRDDYATFKSALRLYRWAQKHRN